jgi:predicted enzyme related to lactoylglutathione lyase
MKVNLSSVLIGVSDIMKAKPFYEKVLNAEFTEVRPPFSCFTMNSIEFNIEENSSERAAGWVERYLGTTKPISFQVDDVNAFLKLVVDNGGKIVAEPRDMPWGWRDAEFADLDGNIFIVEQEL